MNTNGLTIYDWTFDYSYKDENPYKVKKKQVINITEKQKGIVLAHFDFKFSDIANVKSLLKWKPSYSEWMWFKDNNTMEYHLKRFKQMCPLVASNYISIEGTISGYVEPYSGELPKWCQYIDAKEKH